jgi:phospholipase/lecithinase/hemolysin
MAKNKSVRKQILVTGFALCAMLLPLTAQAKTPFSQIVIFGDSLSDTGNTFQATGIPPSPPYFQGRASNGPLWVEYLADDLGLSSDRRTNYAFLGATSGKDNTAPLPPNTPPLPGLQQQLKNFKAQNTKADRRALYVIWVGANDYLGGGVTDPFVPVNNITSAVSTLASYGAKNILVVNLPDLGRIPATRNNVETANNLNALTQFHNVGLAATLKVLSRKTDTNIVSVDVNSLFRRAIANPSEFGLTNVTDACLTQAGVCSNPNAYLFWDNLHPTTGVHALVGELALSSLKSASTSKSTSESSAGFDLLALGSVGAFTLVYCQSKQGINLQSDIH